MGHSDPSSTTHPDLYSSKECKDDGAQDCFPSEYTTLSQLEPRLVERGYTITMDA